MRCSSAGMLAVQWVVLIGLGAVASEYFHPRAAPVAPAVVSSVPVAVPAPPLPEPPQPPPAPEPKHRPPGKPPEGAIRLEGQLLAPSVVHQLATSGLPSAGGGHAVITSFDFYGARQRIGKLQDTAAWGDDGWWVELDDGGLPRYGYRCLGRSATGDYVLAVMWHEPGTTDPDPAKEPHQGLYGEAICLLRAERRPFLYQDWVHTDDWSYSGPSGQAVYGKRSRLVLDMMGLQLVTRGGCEDLPVLRLRGQKVDAVEYPHDAHPRRQHLLSLPRHRTTSRLNGLRFDGNPLSPGVVFDLTNQFMGSQPAHWAGVDLLATEAASPRFLIPAAGEGAGAGPRFEGDGWMSYTVLGRTHAGRYVVVVHNPAGSGHWRAVILLRMVREPVLGYGGFQDRTRLYLDGLGFGDGVGEGRDDVDYDRLEGHTAYYYLHDVGGGTNFALDLSGF